MKQYIVALMLACSIQGHSQDVKQAAFVPPFDFTLTLSGNFGEIRANHFHGGLDFKTQGVVGKPVRALADGYISRIRVTNGSGHVLDVVYNNGYTTINRHLSGFMPDIARRVKKLQYEKEDWEVEIVPEPGEFEADVMQNAIIYLIISVFSFPLLAVYDSCAALYRSMGNAQITLKISLLMNVINVVGNAIGVYVLKLGVAGVAIPSLVSRGVAGVVLFTLLHNPDNLVFLTRGKFKVDGTIVKRILFIGIPSGIENGIFQLGRVLVVSIIAAFGTSQIAANGVANSLDSMGCIVGQAMSLAMITVIGRCVGAGEEGQVRYYTKKLLGETYLYTAVINSIILLLLPWILQIYGLGEETTRLSYILVMIHDGMAIFLWPASFVLPNMLRACNDVKYTMVVSIFSMITFRIGFSYVFGVHMGWMAVGVWAAMVIDWVFRVLCFVGRYLAGTWRKKCGLVAPTA